MKDKVAMSKGGELCVLIPLFRAHQSEEVAKLDGYLLALKTDRPLAYAVDIGDSCQILNAQFVEKHVSILGDLE